MRIPCVDELSFLGFRRLRISFLFMRGVPDSGLSVFTLGNLMISLKAWRVIFLFLLSSCSGWLLLTVGVVQRACEAWQGYASKDMPARTCCNLPRICFSTPFIMETMFLPMFCQAEGDIWKAGIIKLQWGKQRSTADRQINDLNRANRDSVRPFYSSCVDYAH
ncbi:hypothetical protein F5X98DRAFT_10243 [Xylaria grammica]|nr:hypothetical protein F5X98DRAFT_10243 [Xylaria grammica]